MKTAGRAERILWIFQELIKGRRLYMRDLLTEFTVSGRELNRDMRTLQDIIPIIEKHKEPSEKQGTYYKIPTDLRRLNYF